MFDAKAFRHQPVLGIDHVVVVVLREFRLQPIRRLGGFAGTERIRDDDEVLFRIERLALAEKLASKTRREHGLRRACCAMQDQHRLAGGLADSLISHADFRQCFTRMETEIL